MFAPWHGTSVKIKTPTKLKKCKKKHYVVFIMTNSTYLELVEKAKVPTLQVHRIRTMALETFKIINNLSPTCLNSFVKSKTSKYSFRYSNILDLPRVRTPINLLQFHFEIAFRIISGGKTASPSSEG